MMAFFSSTAKATDSVPDVAIVQRSEASKCSPLQLGVVGQDGQSQVEAELDLVIHELGQKGVKALADGDPQGARLYADRMLAAIKSRTPEHVARLEREAEDRIDQGLDYFNSQYALELGRLDVPARAVRRRIGGAV